VCPVAHLSSQECDLAYFDIYFNSAYSRSGVGAGAEGATHLPILIYVFLAYFHLCFNSVDSRSGVPQF
jgi:hypothetical protein